MSARLPRLPAALLALLLAPAGAPAQTPSPAPHPAADTAGFRPGAPPRAILLPPAPGADSPARAGARPDTAVAAADTAHAAADTAGFRAAGPGRGEVTPRSAERPAAGRPAEPLRISASNVTGSRGESGDVVMLNGDVRITRGRTVITADRGRYDRSNGMLYLDDRVKMVDTTITLTCEHAQYSEDADLLQVSDRVTVRDRDATLEAPLAAYDRRAGRVEMFSGVRARDRTQTIRADRLVYRRAEQRVEARGNVIGEDEENRFTLRADSVDYDRVRRDAYARGNPRLESKDEDGRIATLTALRLWLDTDRRVARAVDSVRMVRDTLEARADSARFDDVAERGWLYGSPRAWDRETVVTGDTLEVWTEKREIRRLVVLGRATIDYRGARPNTRGEASRLNGERVDVFFTGDVMDSLRAVGAARNRYTAVARAGKTAETNEALGDTINVYFEDRKIRRAHVLGRASGEYRFAVDLGDTAAAKLEFVRYDAPSITFHVPDDRIVLEPEANLTYREMKLRAGRVEFDSERQTLTASGDPELMDKGDKVTGHLMTYDLESRTGNIYRAETTYERGLYHGEQIRKSGENELDVKAGSYSTCELREPHYHFQAKWMKIQLRDKMVAKPVVFYLKNVPLLALPFWVFPIKPGRHSGLLLPNVEFGFNNQAGQFIRNFGYYWAPSDYFDMTFAGDYYQAEPSWVARFEGVYKLLYRLDGNLRASYRRSELTDDIQWDVSADHTQELTPRTHLIAGAEFVSDRSYRRDASYGSSLAQRLDRFLVSKLSVSHNADWASINVYMDRRQDLDADEALKYPGGFGFATVPAIGTRASLPNLTESLPNASISFPTRNLASFPLIRGTPLASRLSTLYFSLNAQFVSFHQRHAVVAGYAPIFADTTVVDSTTVLDQDDVTRRALISGFSLSDSRRLFGWLNVAPRFGGTVWVFDRDVLGNQVVPTGSWTSGITTGTTLYGTFRPRIGALTGLRHVVAPSVSWSYSPEFPHLFITDSFGRRRPRFEGFQGVAPSGSQASFMSFALDQRLQAKLQRGDRVERLDNLLTWSLRGSYDFLARGRGGRALSPIGSSIRLQPPGFVTADMNWVNDFDQPRIIRTLGYNVNLYTSGGRARPVAAASPAAPGATIPTATLETRAATVLDVPWSLALAYSYSGGYAGPRDWESEQTVNGVFNIAITPNWRAEYLASYDLTEREMLTQRFGLTRDLHCWQATFSRTFTIHGQAEYYFRIGIKEQREIYYERGSRTQSFGGIY